MLSCEVHGLTSGPLCCLHVLDAVLRRGPAVTFRMVALDASGDGRCVIEHMVCEACVARHVLGRTVAAEVWQDQARFPWTAPVCGDCLAELQALPT